MNDDPKPDALLAALAALPRPAMEARAEDRARRAARAAFVESFDDAPWHAALARTASRAFVPLVLASVAGVYLMWAINTASGILH